MLCCLYSYLPFYIFCILNISILGGGVILAWVVVLLVGDIAFHDDSDNK